MYHPCNCGLSVHVHYILVVYLVTSKVKFISLETSLFFAAKRWTALHDIPLKCLNAPECRTVDDKKEIIKKHILTLLKLKADTYCFCLLNKCKVDKVQRQKYGNKLHITRKESILLHIWLKNLKRKKEVS